MQIGARATTQPPSAAAPRDELRPEEFEASDSSDSEIEEIVRPPSKKRQRSVSPGGAAAPVKASIAPDLRAHGRYVVGDRTVPQCLESGSIHGLGADSAQPLELEAKLVMRALRPFFVANGREFEVQVRQTWTRIMRDHVNLVRACRCHSTCAVHCTECYVCV